MAAFSGVATLASGVGRAPMDQRVRSDEMGDEQQGTRKRGWFGRVLGLAAIVGAGALWRQRQQQRVLDEELWSDPEPPRAD